MWSLIRLVRKGAARGRNPGRMAKCKAADEDDDGWGSDHITSEHDEDDEELAQFLQATAGNFLGGFLHTGGLQDVSHLVRKYMPPGSVADLYNQFRGWCELHKLNGCSNLSCNIEPCWFHVTTNKQQHQQQCCCSIWGIPLSTIIGLTSGIKCCTSEISPRSLNVMFARSWRISLLSAYHTIMNRPTTHDYTTVYSVVHSCASCGQSSHLCGGIVIVSCLVELTGLGLLLLLVQ